MLKTPRWLAVATLVAIAALVSGCAGGGAPAAPLRDRVTASDESDASKRAGVRLQLASAYFERGQLTTALDEVKQAIQSDPTLGAAFSLRGLIYAGLGDDALAQESFRRALQIDPRDADVMHNYAWYLCQQKAYADADALFDRAIAQPQYRGVTRSLLAQGVCRARGGQLEGAESALAQAQELDPGNPAITVNLSEVLLRRGEIERARFHIRRVNALKDVSNAQTLWLAARIEWRAGNRRAADDFGVQLRTRFPQSREAAAFERGQFDD